MTITKPDYQFVYSIMHFKHKINGRVNKMNSKHIIREMAKPLGLKHAVSYELKIHMRECR